MKVEVDLISTEYVKPSSPTPDHHRQYQFSFLDQLTPQVYNSMVYFFAADGLNHFNSTDASNQLKKSLSQALTHYYPLAGRLTTHNIHCNDDGAPYMEARVNGQLNDVIKNPIPREVGKLLPFKVDDRVSDFVLGVKFNVFDCGGIAVGACISHQVADALSYFQFIKSWAAITRGEADEIKTHFISATLFPPKDTSGYDPNAAIAEENIASKRFVFNASVIEALRAKYAERVTLEGQKPPSRVEVLSTFIWTRYMAATQVESDSSESHRLCSVSYTVNLRPRMDPPLPDYAFGNYYRPAMAFPSLDDRGECYDLVSQLREQLKKIDQDYILKLQDGAEYLNFLRESRKRLGKGEMMLIFVFTSLCRFPVYDVDFGWGQPTWAGPPAWIFKNMVTFKDTKSDGGIEAYINLTEEDMDKFENDKEVRAHVSATDIEA